MSGSSIFSSYRQGENRVTSTMLAVFERVGLGVTQRVIAGAMGESSLELASFANQPASGSPGTPDAEMRASFRYLIETKTVPNAVAGAGAVEQLRRHLDRLDGRFGDEKLMVITPDPEEPVAVASLGDERVVWIGFGLLAQAIEEVLRDPSELASEQQRFLLRELQSFLDTEGLLSVDDTVVVAARSAYPEYLDLGAYICQPNRAIRNVSYMGFYTEKQIRPEIAKVLGRFRDVEMSMSEAAKREVGRTEVEQRLAAAMRGRLARKPDESLRNDVFVLSRPDEPETVVLEAPVPHHEKWAWTQSQRYTSVQRLQEARDTAEL